MIKRISLVLLLMPVLLAAQTPWQRFDQVRRPAEVSQLWIPDHEKPVGEFMKKMDQFSKLQQLSIGLTETGNTEANLEKLGKALQKLPNLQSIQIELSEFSELPVSFAQISGLQQLDVKISPAEDYYLRSKSAPAAAPVKNIRNYEMVRAGNQVLRVRCEGYGNVLSAEDETLLKQIFSPGAMSSSFETIAADAEIAPTGKKYSIIVPPVPSVEKPRSEYALDPLAPASFLYSSGTLISVPENAFVDKSGIPVSEKVNLYYREYRDQFDILMSGIPMTYDSAGKKIDFRSAGMFEITAATASGKEVFLAPGKQIEINFATTDQKPGYDFFRLNDSTATSPGGWELLSATPPATIAQAYTVPQAVSLYRVKGRSVEAFPDTVKLDARYESAKYCYTDKIKPGTDTAKFRFHVTKRINGKNKVFSTRSLVYLRKVSAHDKSKTYFRIESHYGRHPELSVMKGKIFMMDEVVSGAEFRRRYGKNSRFSDARLTGSGSDVHIELKNWTKYVQADGALVSRNTKTGEFNTLQEKQAQTVVRAYNRVLTSRTMSFNKKIARKLKIYRQYIEAAHNDSIASWKKLRRKMSPEEKAMTFEQWKQYVASCRTRALFAGPNMTANGGERTLTSALSINGLGVFNCDQFYRISDPRDVFVKVRDTSGEKIYTSGMYVVDRMVNGTFSFKGGYSRTVKFSRDGRNSFFAAVPGGRIAYLTPDEFSSQITSVKEDSIELRLNIIDAGEMKYEDIRRILGL